MPRAIASLQRQSCTDFEVVAVDDGSTDSTADILRTWARGDPRVRIQSQPHDGLVAALERGRALARGSWLARMDADDEAHPDRLAAQQELSRRRPELALIGCHVVYASHGRVTDGARRYQRWLNGLRGGADIQRDLWVECPIAHPTFFLRADAAAEVGGYRDRGWPEDYDLLLRIWRSGGAIDVVPRVLLRWWDSPQRLSRTSSSYAPEAFRRCKIHHLRKSLLRDRPNVVVWGAGPTGKAFARSLAAAELRVLAFVEVDPRKVGQTIHGASVVAPPEAGRFAGALHLGAVAQPGGRERVRLAARACGLSEGRDFIAVA